MVEPLSLNVAITGTPAAPDHMASAKWEDTKRDASGRNIPVSGSSNININNNELMSDTKYLYDTIAIPLVEAPYSSLGHWLDQLFDYKTNRLPTVHFWADAIAQSKFFSLQALA